MVRPAARREAAGHLEHEHQVSERRACRLLELHRSTCRYMARPRDDGELRTRLKRLAAANPRYGCPRLHAIVRREGFAVNHKKTHRIYCEEGLQVRRKTRRKRLSGLRAPLEPAARPNQRWSVDFLSDQLSDGRRFRILTLVDDFTRQCLAAEAGISITGETVARVLDDAAGRQGGYPEIVTCDNGPEFAGRTLQEWGRLRNVRINFIEPGKPMQNAFIESFNGKFRDECLNENWFLGLEDARGIIGNYVKVYNGYRPHRSLGGATPDEFLRKEARLPSGIREGELACQAV